jgi:hypothetical protein
LSNIIPFDGDNVRLPAYLRADPVENSDLTSHAGAGFPVISIKGKVFTEVRNGERTIIPNPKDPDSPASYIEVVMVKANKNNSKVWYAAGYDEKSEQKKPDCYSPDGIRPAADSANIQSKTCATCKRNVWGGKITESGKKGKECQDSVRLAVAKPDLLEDPYLLRVPPASIRVLGEYGQMLSKRGVKYNGVVTRISFDPAEATPKLVLKAVGFIDEKSYAKVKEMAESEVVKNILGSVDFVAEEGADDAPAAQEPRAEYKAEPAKEAAKVADVVISKAKTVSTEEVVGTIDKATRGESKPNGAAVTGGLGDLDLGNLSFDD